MADIEAIRARAEAATEGPWRTGGQWNRAGTVGVLSAKSTHGNEDIVASCCDHGADPADATFIAHARQDIPDLLAVIDKVRAIHLPMPIRSKLWCLECESHHPCPTVRALGGDS